MPLPQTLVHYEAELKSLERAMDDPSGIRIMFDTWAEAKNYQFRLHMARALERKFNEECYPPGHHLHRTSTYDLIRTYIREDTVGKWWLYLEKNDDIPSIIESLSTSDARVDS